MAAAVDPTLFHGSGELADRTAKARRARWPVRLLYELRALLSMNTHAPSAITELAAPPLLRHPATVERKHADAAVVAARDDPLVVEAHRAHKVAVRGDAEESRLAPPSPSPSAAARRPPRQRRRLLRAPPPPRRRRRRRQRRQRPARGGARGAARAPRAHRSVHRSRDGAGAEEVQLVTGRACARPNSSPVRTPHTQIVPSADDETATAPPARPSPPARPAAARRRWRARDTHRVRGEHVRQLCESRPHTRTVPARAARSPPPPPLPPPSASWRPLTQSVCPRGTIEPSSTSAGAAVEAAAPPGRRRRRARGPSRSRGRAAARHTARHRGHRRREAARDTHSRRRPRRACWAARAARRRRRARRRGRRRCRRRGRRCRRRLGRRRHRLRRRRAGAGARRPARQPARRRVRRRRRRAALVVKVPEQTAAALVGGARTWAMARARRRGRGAVRGGAEHAPRTSHSRSAPRRASRTRCAERRRRRAFR